MVTMTPWNQTGDGSISGSPFVRAFASIGIPNVAFIMNLVVITAALSSANTNLYLSTRMLFSLARGNLAPALLGRLSANGVPHRALAASSLGMVAAIFLAIYVPKRAFLLMYGSAVAGMYFVWVIILLAHLRFRRSIGTTRVHELPLKLHLFPISNILGIVVLVAIACTTFFVEGLRYSVPAFAALLAIISLLYWKMQRRTTDGAAVQLETSPESVLPER
jgi:L-asparagine transporter-like permease